MGRSIWSNGDDSARHNAEAERQRQLANIEADRRAGEISRREAERLRRETR